MTAALVYVSSQPYSLYVKSAALPGIISGVIWNGGNALSILATRNPAVGLAIAYPSKPTEVLVPLIALASCFIEILASQLTGSDC